MKAFVSIQVKKSQCNFLLSLSLQLKIATLKTTRRMEVTTVVLNCAQNEAKKKKR